MRMKYPRVIAIIIGWVSIVLFTTHNVADAIYFLVMAVWIDKLGERG